MKTVKMVKEVKKVQQLRWLSAATSLTSLTFLTFLTLLPPAYAVKTERWELKTPADFMRGKLSRLTLTSDGELRLGYGSNRLGEFAKEIWCSTVARDGTIYFGTGSPADIYSVGADNQPLKLFETDAIAVTALAIDAKGNLYAATMAEGKIFKIPPGKDRQGTEFCRLPAPYVWALAVDKQDNLLAGTGPDGKIYRISADGKSEEWYAAEDSNILCLAWDADGALLAGGSDRGLLYRITDKGKAVVLHEFGEDEVKSIIVKGRDLYLGVNKQKVRRPRVPAARRPSAAEFEDLTQRLMGQFGARGMVDTTQRARETPPEARLANLLSGVLYVRNADGRIDRLATWDNESVLDMGIDAEGGVLLAMAGAGRVYRVPDSQRWELLFDFDEQQALTLAVRHGRLAFVGTGNVGSGYSIDSKKARDGEFTSEVRDCRFLTTWGNISRMGAGTVTISTRTGNTALPDSTWSAWSDPISAESGKVGSPRARFIQVRAQLSSASDPVLQTLNLYYQIQNQKPEVSSVTVGDARKPVPDRPRTDLPTDDKPATPDSAATDPAAAAAAVAAAAAAPPPAERKPEEFRPKPATTIKKITWRATDKDGDALVYRLFYESQGEDLWIAVPLDKPLKKTDHSWDTESIPDGWYRMKVVASDEESNPVGQSLTDDKASDLFKIDNRRPEIVGLSFEPAASTLSGIARDNLSLIRFLEYSVDGGDWKVFAPKDGVFDGREEPFEVKVEPLAAGPHSIAVRATDEEGNVGVEKLSVRTK
jgi:hypothetical protein